MKATAIDMFKREPEWILALRLMPEFEEMPHDVEVSYWRPSMCNEVGVCVGHWWENGADDKSGNFQVLLLDEEGYVNAFHIYSVFPADPPKWCNIKLYSQLYGGE